MEAMVIDGMPVSTVLLPPVSLVVVGILFLPGIRDNRSWRATVTPLASIIGSGFLVIAPILGHLLGARAVLGMLSIVALAYAVGAVIRFNMRHAEPRLESGELPPGASWTERLANTALSLAYVISVAFYLRLLSAFALRGAGLGDGAAADMLTTLVLAFIGIVGWWRGLDALERLEEYSVSVKLAVIAALLLGLGAYDWQQGFDLSRDPGGEADTWEVLRMLAGLLLVVQGFETSRYLGDAYAADLRIRTMRRAQWLSGGIYVVFVWLATPLFGLVEGGRIDETGVIDLAAHAAWVLGPMLVVAAIMSQFSAAVADTVGAGGLVEEESRHRIGERQAYPLVAFLAIVLVWSANLFEIISLASRAFALYYLLETVLAWQISGRLVGADNWRRRAGLAVVGGLLAFVVVFGKPVG